MNAHITTHNTRTWLPGLVASAGPLYNGLSLYLHFQNEGWSGSSYPQGILLTLLFGPLAGWILAPSASLEHFDSIVVIVKLGILVEWKGEFCRTLAATHVGKTYIHTYIHTCGENWETRILTQLSAAELATHLNSKNLNKCQIPENHASISIESPSCPDISISIEFPDNYHVNTTQLYNRVALLHMRDLIIKWP